jgi:hypothetical protein
VDFLERTTNDSRNLRPGLAPDAGRRHSRDSHADVLLGAIATWQGPPTSARVSGLALADTDDRGSAGAGADCGAGEVILTRGE